MASFRLLRLSEFCSHLNVHTDPNPKVKYWVSESFSVHVGDPCMGLDLCGHGSEELGVGVLFCARGRSVYDLCGHVEVKYWVSESFSVHVGDPCTGLDLCGHVEVKNWVSESFSVHVGDPCMGLDLCGHVEVKYWVSESFLCTCPCTGLDLCGHVEVKSWVSESFSVHVGDPCTGQDLCGQVEVKNWVSESFSVHVGDPCTGQESCRNTAHPGPTLDI